VKVKPFLSIHHTTFGGYCCAIRFLNELMGSLIVGAIGITEEIHRALQPLLQTSAAFQYFQLDFLSAERSQDGMAKRMRPNCDEIAIKRKQVIPIHQIERCPLAGCGSEVRRGLSDRCFSLAALGKP